MTYVDELKEAIRRAQGCEAEHVASVPVREEFQGQTIWEGLVEVFDLRGHPRAARCFAWAHAERTEQQPRYIAILAVPPIDSPQVAVKAALLREVREARRARGAGAP
jgi:hypothetical protein